MELVIGIAGLPLAGKETAADAIAALLKKDGFTVSRHRFSDVLRDTLDLWGVPHGRDNEQRLAQLMDQLEKGTLSRAVKKTHRGRPGGRGDPRRHALGDGRGNDPELRRERHTTARDLCGCGRGHPLCARGRFSERRGSGISKFDTPLTLAAGKGRRSSLPRARHRRAPPLLLFCATHRAGMARGRGQPRQEGS